MKFWSLISVCIGSGLLTGCVTYSTPSEIKRPVYVTPKQKPARQVRVEKTPSAPAVPSAALEKPQPDLVGSVSERPLPFTKDWYEREDKIEQRLREIMIICRGC